MPKLALFDMDGTLFDHDGQLRSDLEKLRAPEEKIDFDMLFFGDLRKLSDEHPHIKSRIDLIRNQPGWWLRLPRLRLGWHVYYIAKSVGFCCNSRKAPTVSRWRGRRKYNAFTSTLATTCQSTS